MPDFKCVYVLIRPKQSQTVFERLEQEVFASEIFEVVFKHRPRADLISRVKPISGDILLENLGLSKEDREALVAETEVIIHCAASTQLVLHLQDAIRINYHGPLKMLALAHECVQLCSFTYISTAYVNSNRLNLVEE